ncbi:MAG: hypothetical protein KF777_25030 [Planctomycetaceae bacterium]|nr:hypothetical protein [Planctomycetaceae bacterium]
MENAPSPQIALVGTTRAGKSVFTAALAKYLERKREGVWLSPKGGSPKTTFAQIDEWWTSLQGGNWLPATPPGTLIELQWDLRVHDKRIPLRMFDYAGENLTDLFGGGKNDATGAAKEFFEKVRAVFDSASILLVLINLESFLEKDVVSAGEHKGVLVTAMSAFLEQLNRDRRSCRVCFVFTAYDQYESVILQKWGSVKNFLEQEVPPLYYEFVDEQSRVAVLPVAAVGETEARVDPHNGKTIRYPMPGFRTKGFGPLVKWLVEAIGDSKVELDAQATESAEDHRNVQYIERLAEEWTTVSDADQMEPIDRFLDVARHGFPYPQRPNAAQLESRRLEYFNAANDLREKIVARMDSERRGFIFRITRIGACVLAAMVLVPLFFDYRASTHEREVERQRLATQQAEAERLKAPRPEVGSEWIWNYTCNKGLFDCWEHWATAKVPVTNKGGPGNVIVTFTVGEHSASTSKFFNQNESSEITVTLNGLPSHAAGRGGNVTAQASE